MAIRISVSRSGKLYAKRVSTHGAIQRAFAEVIGTPVGACVKREIPRGSHPGAAAVRRAVAVTCRIPKQRGMLGAAIARYRSGGGGGRSAA